MITPPGAVEVTPEEFKVLKHSEVQPTDDEDTKIPRLGLEIAARSGSGFIMVFAIIGTVFLVAWIPYVALLAYRNYKNPERYVLRSIFSTQVMNIDRSNDQLKRDGVMTSVRYTILSAETKVAASEKKISKKSNFGFNFEVGHFDFYDLNKSLNQKQSYNSLYWTIGPSFVYGDLGGESDIPMFAKLDLTAGTSFHQDVDLILKAEFSLNYIVDKVFYFGIGGAGFYLYGREGKGIINHVNDLSTQLFGTAGYIF